jgi:hypothetical protein
MSEVNLNPETIVSESRARWLEVISVVSSIVIAEWMFTTVSGLSKLIIAIPVLLAFAVMICSHRARSESLRDIGFRFDNFLQAMRLLALPMLGSGILCLIVGWRLGGTLNLFRWHSNRFILVQLMLGFGWGLVQQYALQGFLNRRTTMALGAGCRAFLSLP